MPQAQREAVTEIIRQATPTPPPVVDDEPVDWPEEILEIMPPVQPQAVQIQETPAESPPVAEEPHGIQLPPVGVALSVDHVRVSENTYAFRLRWSNPVGVTPKRPAVYFQWVSKPVFDMIVEDKEAYGKFKQQIIAEFTEQQKAV